jgi:hypothetical protein
METLKEIEKKYFEPNNLRREFFEFYGRLPQKEKNPLAIAIHTWIVHELNASGWKRKSISVNHVLDSKTLGISVNTLRSNLQYLEKHGFVAISKESEQKNSQVICTLLNRKNGTFGTENVPTINHTPTTEIVNPSNAILTEILFRLDSMSQEIVSLRQENEDFKSEIRASIEANFDSLEIPQNTETLGKVQEFATQPLVQNSYNPQNQTPEALNRERDFAKVGKEFVSIQNCTGYLTRAMELSDNKAEIAHARGLRDYLSIMDITPEFSRAWANFVEMRTYTLNKPFGSVQEAVALLDHLYRTTFGKKGERMQDDTDLIVQAIKAKTEYICPPAEKKQAKQKKEIVDTPEIALLKEIDKICGKEYPKTKIEIAAAAAALAQLPAERIIKLTKHCVKNWAADVLGRCNSKTFLDLEKLHSRNALADESSKITMETINDIAKRANPKNHKEFLPTIEHDETILRFFNKMIQGKMLTSIFIDQCKIYINKQTKQN